MKKTKATSAKTGFGAKAPNFGTSKMGKYTSPEISSINLGGQIAANRFEAGVSIPNEYDDKADFYGKLGKIAGDKPSLASGFFSGLESATKGKANAERRGMREKYDEVMGWMADQNQRIMERTEEKQKEEALSQKYLPEVLAYARAAKNLDPQSQKFTLQSLMDRFNRDGGTDYQIASVDSTDPLMLMVTSPSGQGQVVPLDLRSLFAGQDQIQQQLATFNPEYQQQLQAQRQQQEFENNLATQKLDVDRQGIPVRLKALEQQESRTKNMVDKLEWQKNPHLQYQAKLAAEQGKQAATQRTKLEATNESFYEVTDRVHDLKNLLKNGDVITGDTIGSKFERFLGKLTGSKSYSDTELYDAVAGGLFGFVKGEEKYGNLNQNEFSFLTDRIPTSKKTREALNSLLDQFDRRLSRSVERNNRKLSQIPSFNSYGSEEAAPAQEAQAQQMNAAPADNAGMVKVQRPDGKIVLMDPQTAEEAVKHGGKII